MLWVSHICLDTLWFYISRTEWDTESLLHCYSTFKSQWGVTAHCMLGHISTTTACSVPLGTWLYVLFESFLHCYSTFHSCLGHGCTFYHGWLLHCNSRLHPAGDMCHFCTATAGYSPAGDVCHFCTTTGGSIPAANTNKLCILIHDTKPKIWTNFLLRYLYYNITLNIPTYFVHQGTIVTDSNQRNNP